MSSLEIQYPTLGWKQILSARKEILDAYDRAREQARSHEVQTFHGRVVEASCRKWLSEFLPKRYGVTSGYIVSPGLPADNKVPHFDVIIYDQLDSPVLWIEGNPDSSTQGRSLAIPVEHVRAVLELKSELSGTTVRDALEHLGDLTPLMGAVDAPNARYKLHLPAQFYCGVIFAELRSSQVRSEAILSSLIDGVALRGFMGGVVLRGEGHTLPHTGRLVLTTSKTPTQSTLKAGAASLLEVGMSDTRQVTEHVHIGAMLSWSEFEFARFSFDLIAVMQGTYEVGRISSFYGLGSSFHELIRDAATKDSE
jgi:hypothetical protein